MCCRRGFAIDRFFSQPTMMMLRNIARHPIRAAFTTLGMALATAILVVSLFTSDTMEQLIDVTYFLADRQDATVSFIEKRSQDVVHADDAASGCSRGRALPGGPGPHPQRQRRAADHDQRQTARRRSQPHHRCRPAPGRAAGKRAWRSRTCSPQILGVEVGDFVEVDLLEGQRRTVSLPVAALVEDYFGIRGMMDAEALARLMREAPAVNSVNLSLDENKLDHFYDAIKRMPTVSGMALQRVSLANFREAVALLVTTMASIYTGLAAIIAFGVVYNSARISLSERARELASLRVLGFTRARSVAHPSPRTRAPDVDRAAAGLG